MYDLNTFLFLISLLIVVSILIAKISNNIGLPIMILFLGIGMLAGSEGPGGIFFDDAKIAQSIGMVSLLFILFSGGLETKWVEVKPTFWPAISLATLGVLLTTIAIGLFVHYLLDISWLVSFLLGSVVSSTDAAAVFSILNTRNIRLRGNTRALLEFESGTNDPMAVFLTISIIQLILNEHIKIWEIGLHFLLEMGVGVLVGYLCGKTLVFILNKSKFPIEGFYTVFTLAAAVLIYSLTSSLKGSGFLAVYIAGLIVNHCDVVHKKSIVRFFDGIAWLAQIGMFLTLGLLVFPKQVLSNIWVSATISLFLILVARPISVFISLAFFKFRLKEKALISLVGLRGAVPIILATFPLLAGIDEAKWIFNVVFFIVITSTILQGWPLPWFAKILNMDKPSGKRISSPIEFSDYASSNMQLMNLTLGDNMEDIANKAIVEIPHFKGSLIVTVFRDGKYFVPSGGTILEQGDEIQVLVEKNKVTNLMTYFS
ncbi:MAG: potassium/proton antiporter [Opitutaceae bacterium]|nr:potassium/proton antiporter [Cytophagales bacterium]